MALVLPFTDPAAARAEVAGGKGASLARLTGAGFPVPTGYVVVADAYRAFAAAAGGLEDAVAALDFTDPARLARQCRSLRERLVKVPLPRALARALKAALPPLLAEGPVSVRSSSTLEDLAGAAFAGQHDTFLNVQGMAAVTDAVRRCYASLWEDRAARYRHERGLGQDPAMAVVIQAMVPSEVAGVAFSVHPVTGDLGQVLVNAAWGLGETVVSGEGGIDQFVVDKATGKVLERTVADKDRSIVGSGSGTKTVRVAGARRSKACLSDRRLARLGGLCTKVERFYGFPQDVEWAYAKGALHLLQSRPVTSLPERWTRDESAERFPSPLTPLTWDFTSEGFHESLRHSLALMGLPPFEGRWFERFDGYVYGNQTAVGLFTSGLQVAFDDLDELTALVPVLRARYTWVQELPVTWARDLDRYLLALGRLAAVDLAELDEPGLWRHLGALDALGRSYFLPNIAISITQGILHRMLFRTLALLAGPLRAPGLYDGLTAFCETKTNLVNRDLYDLYRMAREDPALAALLTRTDRRRIWKEGRLAVHPRFAALFSAFLEAHGHREVEFDAYHPTWSGQPWVVLENVRLMLQRDDVTDPGARNRDLRVRQQEAEVALAALVPEPLRFFAFELLRLARAYTALDDLEHYQTTRLSIPFRQALVEIGRRLVGRGVLAEPEDVFFLKKATLTALVEAGGDEAAARVEADRNKADHLRRLKAAPPHVWGEAPAAAPGRGGLKGLPGSPGSAEGPVAIVRSADDFSRFPPGSVLVARTTNPAWTPLFYSACAVVTESGGPLSHGAVTAREVGLPAVMAVRGVMGLLKDGERVRVDGGAGVVVRLGRARGKSPRRGDSGTRKKARKDP